jgi:hypothetical protein
MSHSTPSSRFSRTPGWGGCSGIANANELFFVGEGDERTLAPVTNRSSGTRSRRGSARWSRAQPLMPVRRS